MTNPVLALSSEVRRSGAPRRGRHGSCAGSVAVPTMRHTEQRDGYDGRMFGDAPSNFDRALIDELERSDVDGGGRSAN